MDEFREDNETERTGKDSLIARLYRPGPLVALFGAICAALLFLGHHLLTAPAPAPEVISETKPPVVRVQTGDTLQDKVKEVDLAIIEALRDVEIPLNGLGLIDVQLLEHDGATYHRQILKIPPLADKNVFLRRLHERLSARTTGYSVNATLDDETIILVDNVGTHRLLLEETSLFAPRPDGAARPKLAIVIDDIGEDMRVLKGLLALDFPVNMAVWPYATHTRASVELIAQNRSDLLIHFPMEPRGYPRYNPGEDALFTAMTPDEIRQRIAKSVARIPEAIGVNNHMGSRFTADEPGMNAALAAFKRHGLFFLDSLTTPTSVARRAARNSAVPFYERDIFIDNVKDVPLIVRQLGKAQKVARQKGYAIAIGHPYRETLQALQQWHGQRDESVEIVPISRIAPE